MKRLVFFLCLIVISINTFAQTPNVILSKPVGQSLTVRIALQTAGNVDVDWGNGTTVTSSVGTTQTIAGATQLTGTVGASGAVKIYGTNIVWMNITSQGLTGVDITNIPALRTVDMSTNSISSIDVSNNVNLTYLGIHTNQLTTLDVTANTNLTTLACNNNQLTSLNVANNTKLTTLIVSANTGLNSLDITSNVDLTILRAAGLGLSSINLTNNTKLNEVNLRTNSLTSLDVSSNTLLGSTSAGLLNIGANSFSAAALNQIFTDLPTLAPSANRALTIDANPGAATSNTNLAVAKNWLPNVTGNPTLPLNLLSFTGKLQNGVGSTVVLSWKTAQEVNTKAFAIERAASDGVFKEIGKTEAKNTDGTNTYIYIDNNPLVGTSYYRLQQTDIDGSFTYSNVINIENNGSLSVNVYPIPAKGGKLQVQYPMVQSKNASIKLYSIAGKKVYAAGLQLNSTTSTIDVNSLASANYILVYKSGNQSITKKIVVQ